MWIFICENPSSQSALHETDDQQKLKPTKNTAYVAVYYIIVHLHSPVTPTI